MGQFCATTENITGAQSANQVSIFPDTDKRVKTLDENGNRNVLTPMGWRDNNIIINGEFDYAQRQVPGTLTAYTNTTTRTYTADRWWVANESNGSQFQRVDSASAPETGLQARFYGKYKKITAVGKMMVGQWIEAGNMMHLRGRQVRIHLKMKYSIAASMTVRIGLAQLTAAGTIDTPAATIITAFGGAGTDPTLATNVSYISPTASLTPENCTISGSGLTCVLTAAWVRYSGVFTVPTDCKNLALLIWTNGQLAINDELNIDEVGLYEGYEIRDWFPRPQNEQFLACQRYYWKTFSPDVAPAQNAGVGGALRSLVAIAGAVATSSVIQIRFPVPMRVAPTLVFYNPSAANAFMRNVPGATDATVTAAANITTEAADVNATGAAGWTVGQEIKVHASGDSEI